MPFSFDRSYDENTEQSTLFNYVGLELLEHAFNGFNTVSAPRWAVEADDRHIGFGGSGWSRAGQAKARKTGRASCMLSWERFRFSPTLNSAIWRFGASREGFEIANGYSAECSHEGEDVSLLC